MMKIRIKYLVLSIMGIFVLAYYIPKVFAQVGCDTGYYPANKLHVCYVDGIEDNVDPDTGNTIAQQDEAGIPSPVGSFTAVDHDWGEGEIDSSGRSDNVTGVWRGNVNFQAGTYTFYVTSDDGVTLNLEGPGRVIDEWRDQGVTTYSYGPVTLPAGSKNMRLRWYENGGGALIRFWWTRANALPLGYHDAVENTTCSTWGWSFDPNASSTSITVHIYRDGPAGSGGIFVGGFPTDVLRSDVNSAYGISGTHGFNADLSSDTGVNDGASHNLYVYGLDTEGGSNPLLSTSPKTITCAPPPPPTLVSPIGTTPAGTNTFSWNPVTRAAGYYFRITSNSTIACGRVGDYCPGPQTTTSATYNLTAGTNYIWWVHSYGATPANYGAYNSATVTATGPPPSPSPSPSPPPPSSTCGSSLFWRAKGLVSAPSLTGKFYINSLDAACAVSSKTVFSTVGILEDPFENLKAFYYTQARDNPVLLINKNPPITGPATQTNIPMGSTEDQLYYINGDLNLTLEPTGTKTGIVFVEGNLTIGPLSTGTQFNWGDSSSGMVFIVKGNVIIDKTMTLVDAVIISSGTIYTAGSGCSTSTVTASQLVVNGSLISLGSNQIKFCRTLGVDDLTLPAEKINHQAKYLVILRDIFAGPIQDWSEIP